MEHQSAAGRGEIDLLRGPILPTLTKLSLPITATAFIMMAYSLIDMLWIGRLGSGPMAAVGAAGMFFWLAEGLLNLAKLGGQVFTGQYLGAAEIERARRYSAASLVLAVLLGVFYAAVLLIFHRPLIAFFQLSQPATITQAEQYLMIAALGIVFVYYGNTLTALVTATGNSRLPFLINTSGLVLNILLDPLFIFGFNLGVRGAALATITSQIAVASGLSLAVLRRPYFRQLSFRRKWLTDDMRQIFTFGLPKAVQSMGFAGISIVIARFVSDFGEGAIAVQKVGSQIESISWMTAEGFGTALNAFISQNFGAGQTGRARSGYRAALRMITLIALVNTALLFLAAKPIFSLFLSDAAVLPEGVRYLRILALSQIFMCFEIMISSAFNAFGVTKLPSYITIVFTLARIPSAYLLAQTHLGVSGIWWAITLSSVCKGLFIWLLFERMIKRYDHV